MTPKGKWIYSIFTSSILFILFVKCWQSFLELNPIERTVFKLKRKFLCFVVFTYSIKRSREIRKIHVEQRRLRNHICNNVWGTCKLMCCFANINLLLFFRCRCRCRRCLNSLLLWSRNFATMVTWRHKSLYLSGLFIYHYRKKNNIP